MSSIAVLAGGPSAEHAVSLESAAHFLAVLREGGYAARPVLLTLDGRWCDGAPDDGWDALVQGPAVDMARGVAGLARSGEVAFLGLHGTFGEDGQLQTLLEKAGVPFTGSGAAASRLCFDKLASKAAAAELGARVAPQHVVGAGDPLPVDVPLPCVVKPPRGGSSVATSMVREAAALADAVAAAQDGDPQGQALIEAFVPGTEVTCAVLRVEGTLTDLPLASIHPGSDDPFYDYHAKYESDATRFACPADVSAEARLGMRRVSRALHASQQLRGVVRVDYIVPDDGSEPVFLEVNTLPGFTSHSLVPLAGRAAGMSSLDLVRAVLADVGTAPPAAAAPPAAPGD